MKRVLIVGVDSNMTLEVAERIKQELEETLPDRKVVVVPAVCVLDATVNEVVTHID